MSDTHQWAVTISSLKTVIGEIIFEQSTFYIGPFEPDTHQTIAEIIYRNIGDSTGSINIKAYEYPDTAEENCFYNQTKTNIPINSSRTETIAVQTPVGEGEWSLGVKLWGETEDEPDWGSSNTLIY